MAISKRLKFIADKVSKGTVAADIGTDHGFVPIYLVRNGICSRVIASDKSPGSISKASENVSFFHMQDKIECRLSDGFKSYTPGEIDSVVISGIGGILMVHILSESPEVVSSLRELILSPHRDADLVREYVSGLGFALITDETIEDRHKIYHVMKFTK